MEAIQVHRRVIALTATHYHAADETTRTLPDLATDRENRLHSSLAVIEESILRWDRQLDVLLPPSGDAPTNHNPAECLTIGNIMEMPLNPMWCRTTTLTTNTAYRRYLWPEGIIATACTQSRSRT